MKVEEKLASMGITLPETSPPKALLVPVKQVGNIIYVSGQLPMRNSELAYTGKVGDTRTIEEAQDAARLCIIGAMAAMKTYLGDLDKVKNIIKVQAFVASHVGFDKQPIVINAASQLLIDAFGEPGRHARTALGTNQLPMDATVEIELIAEV